MENIRIHEAEKIIIKIMNENKLVVLEITQYSQELNKI